MSGECSYHTSIGRSDLLHKYLENTSDQTSVHLLYRQILLQIQKYNQISRLPRLWYLCGSPNTRTYSRCWRSSQTDEYLRNKSRIIRSIRGIRTSGKSVAINRMAGVTPSSHVGGRGTPLWVRCNNTVPEIRPCLGVVFSAPIARNDPAWASNMSFRCMRGN